MNSEFKIQLQKFKNDKRAYYSTLVLLTAFLFALPAELVSNVRPLMLVVDGKPLAGSVSSIIPHITSRSQTITNM